MLKRGLGKVGCSFIAKNSRFFGPLPMPDDFYIVKEDSTSQNLKPILAESGEFIVVETVKHVS